MNYRDDGQEILNGEVSTAPLGHFDESVMADYLDGTASKADAAALERHLSTCPACVSWVHDQRSVRSLLHDTVLADAPADLEDRILGELLFPSKVVARPEPQQARWRSLWHGRLRAWMPAAAAVAAVFAFIVIYGVTLSEQQDTMTASDGTTTLVAAETASAAAGSTEDQAFRETDGVAAASPEAQSNEVAPGDVHGTAPTTTAVAADAQPPGASGTGEETTTTARIISPASAPVVMTERRQIVDVMQASVGPVYIMLAAKQEASENTDESPERDATGDATATAAAAGSAEDEAGSNQWVEDAVSQMTVFTEMEPLPASRALGEAAFGCYVEHEQVSHFIDLLLSIAASLRLDLTLQTEVDAQHRERAAQIADHKQELPVLVGRSLPQPAVAKIGFTTSTTAPGDTDSSEAESPDKAGTHVLTIVVLRP